MRASLLFRNSPPTVDTPAAAQAIPTTASRITAAVSAFFKGMARFLQRQFASLGDRVTLGLFPKRMLIHELLKIPEAERAILLPNIILSIRSDSHSWTFESLFSLIQREEVSYDKVKFVRIIAEAPSKDKRKELVDNLVKIIKSSYRADEIIKTIVTLPPDEREDVIKHSCKCILPKIWRHRDQVVFLIQKIAALSAEERSSVISNTERLINKLDLDDFDSVIDIIKTISSIPSLEERESITTLIETLPHTKYETYDTLDILKDIVTTKKENREAVITNAARIYASQPYHVDPLAGIIKVLASIETGHTLVTDLTLQVMQVPQGASLRRVIDLLKKIVSIPPDEREEVISIAVQFMQFSVRRFEESIIHAIADIKPDQGRKDAFENAKKLFSEDMDVHHKIQTITTMATIDKIQRASAIDFAIDNQLITDNTAPYFRHFIVQAAGLLPPHERSFLAVAKIVICRGNIRHKDSQEILLRCIDALPEDQKEAVIKNAFLLISSNSKTWDFCDDADRMNLIETLAQRIPAGERDLITQLTLQVLAKIARFLYCAGKYIPDIIDAILTIEAGERENVITHALQLIRPGMHVTDIKMIIADVAEIAQDQRAAYVRDRLAGVVRGKEAYRHGINVHEGERDEQTKKAMELLYQHQGDIPIEDIRAAKESFMTYLKDCQDVKKRDLAIKALELPIQPREHFGPFFAKEGFTLHGLPLTGEEVIGRLWIFASKLPNEKDQANAKLGMISALAICYDEQGQRVCDQGKTQRLASAVLQGYLAGVKIDEEVEKPSKELALQQFFNVKENQEIENLAALLAAADKFCKDNPLVDKNEFIAELRAYAEKSGIT